MTEDEQFQELERKLQRDKEHATMTEAITSAMHFITDMNSAELGIMTLRKAYEIGYRAGTYAEQRKSNGN
jgi:hypothetical protein